MEHIQLMFNSELSKSDAVFILETESYVTLDVKWAHMVGLELCTPMHCDGSKQPKFSHSGRKVQHNKIIEYYNIKLVKKHNFKKLAH